MKHVACYCRVSTDEQARFGFSIQAQKDTLEKYKQALELNDNYLKNDIINYTHGARCTFKDYKCPNDCKFKHGKTLERKI